ncbi:MAG: hypothetical protein M4D85_06690 [Actinomycetota bacterium]|nr:hypothetical protein [Actinomycetota bacterium]
MDTEVGSEPSRSHRREGTIVALCLFGLLLIGTALEFSRERQSVADVGERAGPMLGESLDLGGRVDNLVSDGVSPTSGIWSVESSEAATTVGPRFPRRGPAVRLNTPGGSPDAVDIATCPKQTGVCAFLIRASRDGRLSVDVRRTSGGPRIELLRTARLPRPADSQRTLQVGRWSGDRADLFVIDRDLPDGTMRVRVLSGESDFKSSLLDVVVPQREGFDRRSWALDLVDVTGSGRSDLVFTTRFAATGTGQTEVHVLDARANYSRYLFQLLTDLDAAEASGRRFLTVLRRRQPLWVPIDARTGRARAYLLAAPR